MIYETVHSHFLQWIVVEDEANVTLPGRLVLSLRLAMHVLQRQLKFHGSSQFINGCINAVFSL